MVRRKSRTAQELDVLVTEAVLGVQSKKYKSSYAAAKALGLCKDTVRKRVNGGLTRVEARQQQQLLSKSQEDTLLKWIKTLTNSGYVPSHQILREVADEIHVNRCRIFQPHNHDATYSHHDQIPNFPLGQDWVPRFIKRHPHLQV